MLKAKPQTTGKDATRREHWAVTFMGQSLFLFYALLCLYFRCGFDGWSWQPSSEVSRHLVATVQPFSPVIIYFYFVSKNVFILNK